MPGAGGAQALEIVERAELGMNGIVAARRGADGVWAAGIARLQRQCVVAALAIGVADGVDGGQIEHVEAERGDLRQPADAIIEATVDAGDATLAPRHHFVPGARPCPRSVGGEWIERTAGEVGAIALADRSSKLSRQQRIGVRLAQRALDQSASRAPLQVRSLARSRRPSSISRLTSSPASRLARTSRRQLANTSVQDLMA